MLDKILEAVFDRKWRKGLVLLRKDKSEIGETVGASEALFLCRGHWRSECEIEQARPPFVRALPLKKPKVLGKLMCEGQVFFLHLTRSDTVVCGPLSRSRWPRSTHRGSRRTRD